MKLIRVIFLCFIFFLAFVLNAQEKKTPNSDVFLTIGNTPSIKVLKDFRIDSFYQDLQILQIKSAFSENITAYQVQVLSTKNRLEALKIKKDLEVILQKMQSEIIFKEPYYKLRVGLFRTNHEAEKFRQKLDLFFAYKKSLVIIPSRMDMDNYLLTFFGKK